LVAAVATQTFHEMIQNGLEYSYIVTGEVFVFLHIRADEGTTLYYHVTVPSDDVYDEDGKFLVSQTAISQVTSLCLMAFKSRQRTIRWRENTKEQLEKYAVDYNMILKNIPESERKKTPQKKRGETSSEDYEGKKDLTFNRSPYEMRPRRPAKCAPNDLQKPHHDRPDDPDASREPDRASASNRNKTKENTSGQEYDQSDSRQAGGSRTGVTKRQYCTQKCLLGIVRKSPLDENCPNISAHRRNGIGHAIDRSEFLDAVQKQLAEDLDHDCEPLGLQGARGALFKIRLVSHGYVFVGKGTVHAFVPDLLFEGHMYQQLESIQGTAVPVCLGNIDLLQWYNLDLGVRILHMLLMSWGGEAANEDEMARVMPELEGEIRRTVAEVERAGVDQMDVRAPNLLWNREAQRVMLIDFERATRIKAHSDGICNVMQEVSPNKRRLRSEHPQQKIKRQSPSMVENTTHSHGAIVGTAS
jgi:hypothetical protein